MENILTRELQEQHRELVRDARKISSKHAQSSRRLLWTDVAVRFVPFLLALGSIFHMVFVAGESGTNWVPVYWVVVIASMVAIRLIWINRMLPSLSTKRTGAVLDQLKAVRSGREQWWENVGALLAHRGELTPPEIDEHIESAGEALLSGDTRMLIRPVSMDGVVWLLAQDGRIVTSQESLRCSKGAPLDSPRSVLDDEMVQLWSERQARGEEDAQQLMRAVLAAGGRTSGRVLHLLVTAAAVMLSMLLDRAGAQDLPFGEALSLFAVQTLGALISGDLSDFVMGPWALLLAVVLLCAANLAVHLLWCRGVQRIIVFSRLSRLSRQLINTAEMEKTWWIQAEHRLRISGLWPVGIGPVSVLDHWKIHPEESGVVLHDADGPVSITQQPARWVEVADDLTGDRVAMVAAEVESISVTVFLTKPTVSSKATACPRDLQSRQPPSRQPRR